MRTSGSGLFPKSPSVDTHSSVTLQQTYYLPFCHLVFPFHTQGRIPFQQRRRLPLARAEWVWPFREKMLHFTGKSANLKKTTWDQTPTLEGPAAAANQSQPANTHERSLQMPNFSGITQLSGIHGEKSVKYSHAIRKQQYSLRLSLKSHQKENDKDT